MQKYLRIFLMRNRLKIDDMVRMFTKEFLSFEEDYAQIDYEPLYKTLNKSKFYLNRKKIKEFVENLKEKQRAIEKEEK